MRTFSVFCPERSRASRSHVYLAGAGCSMLGSCLSPASAQLTFPVRLPLTQELQAAATATCLAAVGSGT